MKKFLAIALIGLALCSCGKDEKKKVEEKKVEKKENEIKIYMPKDVGIDERGKIVDRKDHISVTGKLKVSDSNDQNYILYNVENGRLNGQTVIMDKDNKQIGYGNYINGKKNGKFKFSSNNTTVEAEYKDDKRVGDYKFLYSDKDMKMEYTLKDKNIKMKLTDNKKRKTIPITGEVLYKEDETTLKIRGIAGKNQDYLNSFIKDIPYISIDDIFEIETKNSRKDIPTSLFKY